MKVFLQLVLVTFFIGIVSLLGTQSAYAQSLGEIIIQPTGVANGQTVSMDVMVNSGSEPINAVQANILFPTNWSIKQIDTSNSAFAIQAENGGSNGIVKIARGTIQPVSGVQKIATVTFNGSGSVGDVRVSEDSAIIRSSDSKNLYSGSQNYYANNSVTSPDSTTMITQDVAQSDSPQATTAGGKKGFFDRIVDWNNALWDKIIGLFSKD